MKVVYFDGYGYGNVCNTFVNFLILRDKKRVLKFASLICGSEKENPAGLPAQKSARNS